MIACGQGFARPAYSRPPGATRRLCEGIVFRGPPGVAGTPCPNAYAYCWRRSKRQQRRDDSTVRWIWLEGGVGSVRGFPGRRGWKHERQRGRSRGLVLREMEGERSSALVPRPIYTLLLQKERAGNLSKNALRSMMAPLLATCALVICGTRSTTLDCCSLGQPHAVPQFPVICQ